MSMRDKLIEAAAKALCEQMRAEGIARFRASKSSASMSSDIDAIDEWGLCTGVRREWYIGRASLMLDAILTTLASADEAMIKASHVVPDDSDFAWRQRQNLRAMLTKAGE